MSLNFTLILTFSHQATVLASGRRNTFIISNFFFPRPLVGEGQGEGALFSSLCGAAKSHMRVYLVKYREE